MTEFLTGLQVRALEQLATYRFLNRRQLQRVGVCKDPTDLRNGLSPLINRRWIGRTEKQPALAPFGRLDHLYWLYQAGADAFADLRGTKPVVARTRDFKTRLDLPHMYALLDAHISLRQWAVLAGATVDWFKADFEPGQARGLKATTLPYQPNPEAADTLAYSPDGVAQVTLADGYPRLLVFEVYRGGWENTLSHFWDALPMLRRVCETNAVERHFGGTTAARFIVLFFNADMRDQALTRWRDASADVFGDFYVKHMDELTAADFAQGWRQPGRPSVDLF